MRKRFVVAIIGAAIAVAGWLGVSTTAAEGGCKPGVVAQSCPPPPLDVSKTTPPPGPPPGAVVAPGEAGERAADAGEIHSWRS